MTRGNARTTQSQSGWGRADLSSLAPLSNGTIFAEQGGGREGPNATPIGPQESFPAAGRSKIGR